MVVIDTISQIIICMLKIDSFNVRYIFEPFMQQPAEAD